MKFLILAEEIKQHLIAEYKSIRADNINLAGSETTEDFNDGRMHTLITISEKMGLTLSDLRGK